MMWSLWEDDCKMLKKYLDHWSKKRIRNKWYKTTFMIVSRKPYDKYEYVKLGTYKCLLYTNICTNKYCKFILITPTCFGVNIPSLGSLQLC